MTDAEARSLVAALVAAYPSLPVSQATLDLYAAQLADLDAREAFESVQRHIATSKFFPSVAEIRQPCADRACAAPTSGEAWDEVVRAVAVFGRNRQPEWSHDAIARTVDGIGGWRSICDSTNTVADRSQFVRLYDEERKRAVAEVNVRPLLERAQTGRAFGPVRAGAALLGGKK